MDEMEKDMTRATRHQEGDRRKKTLQKLFDRVFLLVMIPLFIGLTAFLWLLPRSTVSETERRELKEFPAFSLGSYFSGDFTADVSEWFSDTVPYRDNLNAASMSVKDHYGFRADDVKLHNVAPLNPVETPTAAPTPSQAADGLETPVATATPTPAPTPHTNNTIDDAGVEVPDVAADDLNITNNGIAVVGKGAETRALMLFGGSMDSAANYAQMVSRYKEELGEDVNVYDMVIPCSSEFYSPPSLSGYNDGQLKFINHIIENLSDNVYSVDIYTPLSQHLDEPIYLRTDHHWGSLGAYYAAQEFARAAEVPFLDISEYEKKTVHDYVGSMYGYSKDAELKNNPEDFDYYVKEDLEIKTVYRDFASTDSEPGEPYEGNFFYKYKDGSGLAYCTFMGGDSKLTQITTPTQNGRKLVILKDSFGNALPQFLFGSFEEIHVIDFRYFSYNIKDYCAEHGITDVLFADNIFNSTTSSLTKHLNAFLDQ